MNRAIVIADDLTGANDTGAMLADLGFCAMSSPTAIVNEEVQQAHVLTINADSRTMPASDAYACVRSLTERFGRPVRLLSKRIDSTLRGNVGAEIDAVLDGLGEPACACVVTAAPRAERTCRDGKVYVSGVLLENTDISRDVRCSVHISDVCEIIRRQSKRAMGKIGLAEVRGDLEQALEGRSEEIIVFDAETDADIERIAKAAAGLKRRVVAVDPGNFTAAYAKFVLRKRQGLTLLVIGSRSEPSREQLEYLSEKENVHPVVPDISKLLSNHNKSEWEKVTEQLRKHAQTDPILCVTLVGTPISEQSRSQAQSISDAFASLGAYVLAAIPQIDLCYVSGGDVCQSLMKAMGIKGIRLISEVIPLAVYGEVIGGRYHGFKLLTKGGMIGREDAIETMIQYARREKEQME